MEFYCFSGVPPQNTKTLEIDHGVGATTPTLLCPLHLLTYSQTSRSDILCRSHSVSRQSELRIEVIGGVNSHLIFGSYLHQIPPHIRTLHLRVRKIVSLHGANTMGR